MKILNRIIWWLERTKEGIFRFTSIISPRLNTQLRFYDMYGHTINLNNPQTFSEKISWLKIYDYAKDKTVAECSDKYTVRDFVSNKGLGECLNDLFGVYTNVEDIPWENLPNSFVIKWNYGCGFNIICADKSNFDYAKASALLKHWGKKEYWRVNAEKQYKNRSKYLLCEKYIEPSEDGYLMDYKIYCFSGEPKAILVMKRKDMVCDSAAFMSVKWEKLDGNLERYGVLEKPPKPFSLECMLRAASILSDGFPFVRVDFYESKGKAIFGEMTFTPHGGVYPSETQGNVLDMGSLLKLNV